MTDIRCPKCGSVFQADVPTMLDSSSRARVMDGSAFVFECPQCGEKTLALGQFIYNDPELKLLVVLSADNLVSDGLPGYTCRLVSDIGSLMEKVKIADAGLDDVVVELCKALTLMDMGVEADLKFFRMDGPDGEMTFTYPSAEGKMEMIAAGSSVYASCQGIVSRNPAFHLAAKGLSRVDRLFISEFLK